MNRLNVFKENISLKAIENAKNAMIQLLKIYYGKFIARDINNPRKYCKILQIASKYSYNVLIQTNSKYVLFSFAFKRLL